jgi:signal transduction histidine kinase
MNMADDFQTVTQQLYKKNLELVNTNKELALLEKTYEIMAATTTIRDLTQRFIDLLITETNFSAGQVILYNRQHKRLKAVAYTKTSFDDELARYARMPINKFHYGHCKQTYLSQQKAIQFKQPLYDIPLAELMCSMLDEELTGHLIEKTGVKLGATFPIASRKAKGGAFTVYYTDSVFMGPLERRTLSQMAIVLGLAVDRAILVADMKVANTNLKQLNKMKNDFINIATHELKNPVAAMRGFLGMLNEGLYGVIPDKLTEPISMIHQCNEQVVELVNDLLQIARSESKRIQFAVEPVDLLHVVDMEMKILQPLLDKRGLQFKHQKPPFGMVTGDSQKVQEVVHNLLANAIKYSESGTIEVTYSSEYNMLTTSITDHGYGIDPADMDQLFGRFFRAHNGIAHNVPGTGLGLFIVKQYVEKMGGSVGVESTVGKGSRFWFSLPVEGK